MRAAVIFAGVAVLAAVAAIVLALRGPTPDSPEPPVAAAPASEAVAGPAPAAKETRTCLQPPPPPDTHPPETQDQRVAAVMTQLTPRCQETLTAAVSQGQPELLAQLTEARQDLHLALSNLLADYQSCQEAAGVTGACAATQLTPKQRHACASRVVLHGGLVLAAATRQPCTPDLLARCDRLGKQTKVCRAACAALGGKGAAACTGLGATASICRVLTDPQSYRCPPGPQQHACNTLGELVVQVAAGESPAEARWVLAGARHGAKACTEAARQEVARLCAQPHLFEIDVALKETTDP